jgi:hypothetical protein
VSASGRAASERSRARARKPSSPLSDEDLAWTVGEEVSRAGEGRCSGGVLISVTPHYCDPVNFNASDRAPSTKGTYIQRADRFVRWLAGKVTL